LVFSAGCNSAKARAQVREEIAVSLSRTILIGLGLGIVSGISFGEEVPSKCPDAFILLLQITVFDHYQPL
jgi:hypothetical protein